MGKPPQCRLLSMAGFSAALSPNAEGHLHPASETPQDTETTGGKWLALSHTASWRWRETGILLRGRFRGGEETDTTLRAVGNRCVGSYVDLSKKRVQQNNFSGRAFLLLYKEHNKLNMSDCLSWHLWLSELKVKYQHNIKGKSRCNFSHGRKLLISNWCLTHFRNKHEMRFFHTWL